MAIPVSIDSSWFGPTGVPSGPFGTSRNDYELHEEDGEFVLSVEMPGFDPGEIDLVWADGILTVAAEHESGDGERQRGYRRRLRFPKDVDEDGIEARYTNGILEVRLPTVGDVGGTRIPVEN